MRIVVSLGNAGTIRAHHVDDHILWGFNVFEGLPKLVSPRLVIKYLNIKVNERIS